MLRMLFFIVVALLLFAGVDAQTSQPPSQTPTGTQTDGSSITDSPQYAVIITYSRCTSTTVTATTSDFETTTSSVEIAVPPITKTIPISPVSSATSRTPISTYTTGTSSGISILRSTDIDPVEFAWQSHNYQPADCLIATQPTPVDYRSACSRGPEFRKPPGKVRNCGPDNPCCYDCSLFGPAVNVEGETREYYGRCADGVEYWSDGKTEVNDRYSLPAPVQTAGEWTDEQRAGQADTFVPTSSSSSSTAGAVGVTAGNDGLVSFAAWLGGILVFVASAVGL